ncbi:9739_t:CDS:1, partial [Acaulospora colombiana]
MSRFKNLTWLDYQADIQRGQPVPIDKFRVPVILPNLQTLWYKNRATFEFPFSYLVLPSLQYLSLHIYELPSQVPLLDILSRYQQTLRSFAARGWKRRGDLPVVHFPSWDNFPILEELVLDIQWTSYLEPLPSGHPLRRLDVRLGSFDVIPSLLESENMQELILQRTRWTGDGRLTGSTEELTISTVEVEHLLEWADERGISIKVTWDWDEFLSRDEAIAAAAEASNTQK